MNSRRCIDDLPRLNYSQPIAFLIAWEPGRRGLLRIGAIIRYGPWLLLSALRGVAPPKGCWFCHQSDVGCATSGMRWSVGLWKLGGQAALPAKTRREYHGVIREPHC